MLTFPMPTCTEVRRELEALAMNELRGSDLVLVRKHLDRCTDCRRAAREVAHLVEQLTGLRPRRARPAWRALAIPASIAAAIAVVVALELRPAKAGAPPAPAERTYAISGIAELIKAQGSDGAWREPGDDRSPALTVGLSGLAAVGCLRAGDSGSATAGRLGCDFIAKTLAQSPLRDSDAPPDLRLRAQASAAWALVLAAERWPDRYHAVASRALRDLASLEETWARPDGGLALDEMTRLLLTSAHEEAGAGKARAAPARLAVRLLSDSEHESSGAPVTRLATRVLAGALPRPGASTF